MHRTSSCLPLAFVAVTAIFLQATNITPHLLFEHSLIRDEPWRLVTGNFVHLGWTHLGLNLAALTLAWLLFMDELEAWEWMTALLICSLGVGSGLFLLSPEVEWYVGLSGVLHGALISAALVGLRKIRAVALLTLVLLAGKITLEQLMGNDIGTAELIGAAVIVDAHLYGAVAGTVCGVIFLINRIWSRTSPHYST